MEHLGRDEACWVGEGCDTRGGSMWSGGTSGRGGHVDWIGGTSCDGWACGVAMGKMRRLGKDKASAVGRVGWCMIVVEDVKTGEGQGMFNK